MPECRTIPSSVLPLSPISNGGRDWRSETHRPGQRLSSTRLCPDGAGGKLPPIDHRRHRRCGLADFASASLPPIGVLGHSRHWGEGSKVVSKASWYLPHCSSQTMVRCGAAVRLPSPSPCSVDRTFKWALLPRQTPQGVGNESRYCNGRSRPALGVAGRHGLLGIASEVDDV